MQTEKEKEKKKENQKEGGEKRDGRSSDVIRMSTALN